MEESGRPGRARWAWVRRGQPPGDPVVRAMVVAFAVVRFLGVIATGAVNASDSPTYRVRNSFLDFSLTSLDGHSIRPWGVTIWMAVWPGDEAILLAQVALSVVAWSILAVTLAEAIEHRVASRVTAGIVLLVACTAQVTAWDANILSESVSISTGILALSAGIRFTRRPTWARATVFVLGALWFAMTRPNVFPVLLGWAGAMVVVGLVRHEFLRWGAVAGLFVLISAYAFVYNVRSDDTWRATNGVTRTTIAYAYPISANDPVAEAVLADLRKSDAPRCMIPATPKEVTHSGTTQWVYQTARACPGMDAWATANWSRWWASWLLHHPGQTMKIIHAELPDALSPPVYANVSAPAPSIVGRMFFGSPAIPQSAIASRSYRDEPVILWLGAALALAVVGRRRLRGGTWPTDLVILAGAGGALVAATTGGLLIQAAPDGVGRESAGVTVLLTASCIALVGLGLGRALRSEAAPAAQPAARAPERTRAERPSGRRPVGDGPVPGPPGPAGPATIRTTEHHQGHPVH